MKNVFFGVIAAGVVYLVVQNYRKSKKKCGCSGAAASIAPGSSTTQPVVADAVPVLNANGQDGFGKKVF